jgi:hypothetical protein
LTTFIDHRNNPDTDFQPSSERTRPGNRPIIDT